MARIPTLTYDRGTLILHPPPRGKEWMDFAVWDDRIEKFRVPAIQYRNLVTALRSSGAAVDDKAKAFQEIQLTPSLEMEPYPHQQEALDAWIQAGKAGLVVLPTAAGKTYLAQLAMQATQRSTLIMVPTLDLMHQWYAHLVAAFPDVEIGLLGGGSRDRTPILVSTYDSAAIHAENLGNQYALLVFDECHHLPSDFNRVIAEYAIAPYRLGLTATPERTDGKHADLTTLIGAEVYRRGAAELSGTALARHKSVQIKVRLSQKERDRYDELTQLRNEFLKKLQHLSGQHSRLAALCPSQCPIESGTTGDAGSPRSSVDRLWHGGQAANSGRSAPATFPGADADLHRRQRHGLPDLPGTADSRHHPPNWSQGAPRSPDSV